MGSNIVLMGFHEISVLFSLSYQSSPIAAVPAAGALLSLPAPSGPRRHLCQSRVAGETWSCGGRAGGKNNGKMMENG